MLVMIEEDALKALLNTGDRLAEMLEAMDDFSPYTAVGVAKVVKGWSLVAYPEVWREIDSRPGRIVEVDIFAKGDRIE